MSVMVSHNPGSADGYLAADCGNHSGRRVPAASGPPAHDRHQDEAEDGDRADAPAPVPHPAQAREAFIARLYAEHGPFLMAFVTRLTGGDRHWAEDVVQETLVRAWRHADALLGGGARSLLPWLTTVARRIVINDRRSRRVRPQEVDLALMGPVGVADDTDRALQRAVLIEALKGIAAAHRRVVVEMYLRGRTVEEVARLLGVPPGTVKSRSFYALRALRAALRERGVTP